MFKKFLLILLVVSMLISNVSIANSSDILVFVDNAPLKLVAQPFMQNDRVLVPFRAIAVSLRVNVSWDDDTKTVTATKDDKKIIIQIGTDIAIVNDAEIKLDVPAMIKDSRTYVPLRFFSENFEANVDWIDNPPSVVINNKPINMGDSIFTRKVADKEFSLINNRLFIKMPEGAQDEAVQGDIMGAAPSNDEQTTLILESKNYQRLVVSAKEMFNLR